MKTKLLILSLLTFFTLKGQVAIDMTISPSMEETAYLAISKIDENNIKVIFTQRDITEEGRISLLKLVDEKGIGDKPGYVQLDSLSVLINQLLYTSLSDSCTFSQKSNMALFKTLNDLLQNTDSLSREKDKRLIMDGMSCHLQIKFADKNYKIEYRAPQSKYNFIIHQFIKQLLNDFKTTSTNKKVQDYCNNILAHYLRDEGGAFVDFGELK